MPCSCRFLGIIISNISIITPSSSSRYWLAAFSPLIPPGPLTAPAFDNFYYYPTLPTLPNNKMHGLKSLLTLLAGSSLAVSLALPVPAQDAALVARQDDAPDCAAAKKLAAGIDSNIKAQRQEQADVAAVKKIVSAEDIDQAQFDEAKKTLVTTVDKGIQIRENNQKITPAGNAAVAGLDKVRPLPDLIARQMSPDRPADHLLCT